MFIEESIDINRTFAHFYCTDSTCHHLIDANLDGTLVLAKITTIDETQSVVDELPIPSNGELIHYFQKSDESDDDDGSDDILCGFPPNDPDNVLSMSRLIDLRISQRYRCVADFDWTPIQDQMPNQKTRKRSRMSMEKTLTNIIDVPKSRETPRVPKRRRQ